MVDRLPRSRPEKVVACVLASLASCAAIAWSSLGARAEAPLATAAPSVASPCSADALRMRADFGDGEFTGAMHAGARVIVTNVSRATCTVARRGTFALRDARGALLPVTFAFAGTRFMHPGPVLVPLSLAPGGTVSTTLRWVEGNVYDGGRCVTAATLTLKAEGSHLLRAPLGGTVCGPPSGISVETMFFVVGSHAGA